MQRFRSGPDGLSQHERTDGGQRERLAHSAAQTRGNDSPEALVRLRVMEDRALALLLCPVPPYRADLTLLCARLFAAVRLAAGDACTGVSLPDGPMICACSPRPFTAAALDLCDAALRSGDGLVLSLERSVRHAFLMLRCATLRPVPPELLQTAAAAARAVEARIVWLPGKEQALCLALPLRPADGLPEYPLPTVGEYLYGRFSPLHIRLPQLFENPGLSC